LRFEHADWQGIHPDEPITLGVVEQVEHSGKLDTNWRLAGVPASFRYDQYNFSSYLLAATAADAVIQPAVGWLLKKPGRDAAAIRLLFLRYLSGALGVLACFLTWVLARRYVPDWLALFAAALAAAFPLLVQDSHYARPETFVTAVFLGALLCFDAARSRRSLWTFCGGCLLLGVLLASKVSFAPLLYLAAVPLLWTGDVPVRKARWAAAAGAALVIGAFIGAPYAFQHPGAWWNGVRVLQRQYAMPFWPYTPFPDGWCFGMLATYFFQTCGLGVLLLALVAAFTLARAKRADVLALLIAPMLLSTILFGFQQAFFERNLSHLAPLYAVTAAIGLAALWREKRLPFATRTAVAGIVAVASIAVPLRWSWVFVNRVLDPSAHVARNDFENRLAAQYGHRQMVSTDLFISTAVADLRSLWLANPDGSLLRVEDFNDPVSRHSIEMARKAYGIELLAAPPHPLDGLSVNTMWSHLPRLSYYLVPPDLARTRHIRQVALADWRMTGGWKPAGGSFQGAPAYLHAEYTLDIRSTPGAGRIVSSEIHLCRGDVLVAYAMRGPDPAGVEAGLDLNGDGRIEESIAFTGAAAWRRYAFEADHDRTVRFIAEDRGASPVQWLVLAQPAVYSAAPCAAAR
jgi:hypothetical protein